MTNLCTGCSREFLTEKSINAHQKRCLWYDQYLCGLVSEKHALEAGIEAPNKRARTTDNNIRTASDLEEFSLLFPLVSEFTLCAHFSHHPRICSTTRMMLVSLKPVPQIFCLVLVPPHLPLPSPSSLHHALDTPFASLVAMRISYPLYPPLSLIYHLCALQMCLQIPWMIR